MLDFEGIKRESLYFFKEFLKFDTSNPPGNELPLAQYIDSIFKKEKIDSKIIKTGDNRGCVVARISGGDGDSLLLSSHLDVVPAGDGWSCDPFGGIEKDGFVYGRGAVDMKNMLAYSVITMIALKRMGKKPKGDVVFCAVSDEEEGGHSGAKFLVENHPELLGCEFGLGEVGGFTNYINKRPFYPIGCGEKGYIWIKIGFKAKGGHGSIPQRDDVIHMACKFVEKLSSKRMKPELNRVTSLFFKGLSEISKGITSFVLGGISSGIIPLIYLIPAEKRRLFEAMLSNTVSVTGIESFTKQNVIPSFLRMNLDCRILPDSDPSEVLRFIGSLLPSGVDVEVVSQADGFVFDPKSALYDIIEETIKEMHPGASVVPYLNVGFTDAHHYKRLGTKIYGFAPVRLPEDINFSSLFHGVDERIPVDGFLWGTECLVKTVATFLGLL